MASQLETGVPNNSGNEKSTMCLVHGAWHGPWCWDLLRPELEAKGHPTIAPNLPIDDPEADFNDYAEVVVKSIIESGATEIDLVGHSRSGNVIPRVSEMLARETGAVAIRNLIYVAAAIEPKTIGWLPEEVLKPFDKKEPFKEKGMLYEIGMKFPSGNGQLFNRELAKETFYHDCEDDVAEWATNQLRPQYRPDNQSIIKRLPEIPSYYVICTEDRVIPANEQADIAYLVYQIPMRRIRFLRLSHSPMLAEPEQLADYLVKFSEAT